MKEPQWVTWHNNLSEGYIPTKSQLIAIIHGMDKEYQKLLTSHNNLRSDILIALASKKPNDRTE